MVRYSNSTIFPVRRYTGYLGRRLVARLERPVVLTRAPSRARAVLGDVEARWPMSSSPPNESCLASPSAPGMGGYPRSEMALRDILFPDTSARVAA
ncbi:hypothetical protein [Archangium lipolyticum]|uniref:hypothetical protein n=1 Tax=Archangium lipolyticum TaxID=2970465 RepID=UPI002149A965|nr:hypothetical protein [Archangium lipolyticum]